MIIICKELKMKQGCQESLTIALMKSSIISSFKEAQFHNVSQEDFHMYLIPTVIFADHVVLFIQYIITLVTFRGTSFGFPLILLYSIVCSDDIFIHS